MTTKEKSEKNRERRMRRWLAKNGYILKKSRVRNIHADNLGGYQIISTQFNHVFAGEKWELDLEGVSFHICYFSGGTLSL